jgi:hypothetical protein
MYAKTMDEDECTEWLEEVLSTGSNGQKKTTSSKKKGRRGKRVSRGSCRSER